MKDAIKLGHQLEEEDEEEEEPNKEGNGDEEEENDQTEQDLVNGHNGND